MVFFRIWHQQDQAATRFGQYRRPRTLSAGDLTAAYGSGIRIGGGGSSSGSGRGNSSSASTPINPAFTRLAEALREHMHKIYCSQVLRALLRSTPVTTSTLLTVRRCLRPVPPEEITRFLVREFALQYMFVLKLACYACLQLLWFIGGQGRKCTCQLPKRVAHFSLNALFIYTPNRIIYIYGRGHA